MSLYTPAAFPSVTFQSLDKIRFGAIQVLPPQGCMALEDRHSFALLVKLAKDQAAIKQSWDLHVGGTTPLITHLTEGRKSLLKDVFYVCLCATKRAF